jgi:hypothetical protein
MLAAALLLSACVATGTGRYLLVAGPDSDPDVWETFETLEACRQGMRESQLSDMEVTCIREPRPPR